MKSSETPKKDGLLDDQNYHGTKHNSMLLALNCADI